MTTQLSVIPSIIEEARARTELDTKGIGGLSEKNTEAVFAYNLLVVTEIGRGKLEKMQAAIVARIARENLHLYCVTRNNPNAFGSVEEMITAALDEAAKTGSINPSRASRLRSVARIAATSDVDIETLIENHWPRLREALPALNRAIRNEDEEELANVLETVENETLTRDTVRSILSKKKERIAEATFVLVDGKAVLVAVMDNDDSVRETIVNRLNGYVEWGMVATCRVAKGNVLKITAEPSTL